MPAKTGDDRRWGRIGEPAEALARSRGVEKDVLFLGKQNGIKEKLGQADLFLLPSQLESFGLAALEAMACEVPVIATNVGGVPEVIEHGVDGYLVEPGDVKTAAKYAIELLSRPDRGREIGQLARVQRQEKILRQRRLFPCTKIITSKSSPAPTQQKPLDDERPC